MEFEKLSRPENGNNVPPESGDTLLSREQK